MSETLEIGLSKDQVEMLLRGKTIGKRPYAQIGKCQCCGSVLESPRYSDTIRVNVRMLTDEERKKEPDSAFGW